MKDLLTACNTWENDLRCEPIYKHKQSSFTSIDIHIWQSYMFISYLGFKSVNFSSSDRCLCNISLKDFKLVKYIKETFLKIS